MGADGLPGVSNVMRIAATSASASSNGNVALFERKAFSTGASFLALSVLTARQQ
jgi:hypothetical protein